MSEALKPCPFCGSKAAEPWFDDDDQGSSRGEVYCTGCTATTQGGYHNWIRDENDMRQSIDQAVIKWNTRADLPATDEQAFANEKVKALVEALIPYAALARHHAADAPEWGPFDSVTAQVSIRNLRDARSALAGMEKE